MSETVTLTEIQKRLAEQHDIHLSVKTLRRQLKERGLEPIGLVHQLGTMGRPLNVYAPTVIEALLRPHVVLKGQNSNEIG